MLQYYTTRPWVFHNDKLKKLYGGLNETDKRLFSIDWNSFNADEYMLNFVLGVRKYCVHEDLDTLPKARRTLRRFVFYCIGFVWSST